MARAGRRIQVEARPAVRVKRPEDAFTDQVLTFAKLRGWRTAHFRPSRTATGWRTAVQGDGKGWPDLVLVRGATVIYAELKIGRNKLTPEQAVWLESLRATGARVYEWRPENWPEIERVLEEA